MLIFSYFLSVSNPVSGHRPEPKFPKKDFSNVYECEFIIDDKQENGERQFLCKWTHYPYYESTWVKQEDITGSVTSQTKNFFNNYHYFIIFLQKIVFFLFLNLFTDALIADFDNKTNEEKNKTIKVYNNSINNHQVIVSTRIKQKLQMQKSILAEKTTENRFKNAEIMLQNNHVKKAIYNQNFIKATVSSQSNARRTYNITIKTSPQTSAIIQSFCSSSYCKNDDVFCKHVVCVLLLYCQSD